jgi:hypothetical protein
MISFKLEHFVPTRYISNLLSDFQKTGKSHFSQNQDNLNIIYTLTGIELLLCSRQSTMG